MTEFNKIVYLDTAPIVYFLDKNPYYGDITKRIVSFLISVNAKMVSSTITCEEYLVYAYRTGYEYMERAFFDFLSDCQIEINDISRDIAKKAAHIRAEYKSFKAMDALQLATACIKGCDIFLTNDKQLLQFHELQCVMVEQFFEVII